MPETLGRYELIAEIGRGGMADVKLAIQREPGPKLVVLKLVQAELASDTQIVEMFREEGKLSALIKHPNVVDVFELGEHDGKPFIAMEYLEGEPLLAVLDTGTLPAGKRLDPLSMARIIADTAEGLDAAHTLEGPDGKPLGLVHHDVSLGNIFVLYSGQVKLLDFGVARAGRAAAKKKDDKVFGKLAYMAPEKLDDRAGRSGDRRSDIWSLGCVLWEALTFKRLFKGANDVELIREVRYVNVPPPSSVNSEVPSELDAIVGRALQRDPFRRYQNAKEMAVAIEAVLSAKGYPSKNYKIGGYMMQAFADVIAARERLLREVAGPEARPSTEALEAFTASKRDSLPSFEHLIDPVNQVVLPEGSTGAEVAIAVPTGNPFEEDNAQTVFDDVPANAEASRAVRYEADPSWIRGKHAQGLKELQQRAQEMRENPSGYRRKKMIPYAIGGVALLAIVILAAKTCGGGGGARPAAVAKPEDASGVVDAAIAKAARPDAAVAAPAGPPVDAAVVEEIEMPPEELADDKQPEKPRDEDKKPRPKPTKSAQALYTQGLAAWKKKDLKAAYTLFTDGRRANSRYPNNWYGLGMVHEKAGRKADARTAYERYLKLAPNAPNSRKLRDHIKRNL